MVLHPSTSCRVSQTEVTGIRYGLVGRRPTTSSECKAMRNPCRTRSRLSAQLTAATGNSPSQVTSKHNTPVQLRTNNGEHQSNVQGPNSVGPIQAVSERPDPVGVAEYQADRAGNPPAAGPQLGLTRPAAKPGHTRGPWTSSSPPPSLRNIRFQNWQAVRAHVATIGLANITAAETAAALHKLAATARAVQVPAGRLDRMLSEEQLSACGLAAKSNGLPETSAIYTSSPAAGEEPAQSSQTGLPNSEQAATLAQVPVLVPNSSGSSGSRSRRAHLPTKPSYEEAAELALFTAELSGSLAERITQLNTLHVTQVLYALGKLSFHPGGKWLTAALGHSQQLLLAGAANGRNLALLIWALARLGTVPDDEWMSHWKHCSQQFFDPSRQPGMGPQDISNISWALAKLQQRPDPAWSRDFLQASLRALPQATPQALSNTLWGLAKMGVVPSEQWMQALLKEVRVKVATFGGHELCNTMWALSVLRCRPPPDITTAVLGRAEAVAHSFTPQGAACMLWALTKLQLDPGPRFMDAFLTVSYESLEKYSGRDLGAFLWSLALQDYNPTLAWMARYLEVVSARLPNLNASVMTTILWSLGNRGFLPSRQWLRAFIQQLGRQMQQLSGNGLGLTLQALAVLGIKPPREFMSALLQRAAVVMHTCSSQDLPIMGWALARLRCRPPPQWVEGFLAAAEPKLPECSAKNLSNLLWSLGMLRHQPSRVWVDAWEDAALIRFGAFTSQGLFTASWAYQQLGLVPGRALLDLLLLKLQNETEAFEPVHRLAVRAAVRRWLRDLGDADIGDDVEAQLGLPQLEAIMS